MTNKFREKFSKAYPDTGILRKRIKEFERDKKVRDELTLADMNLTKILRAKK